MARSSLSNSPSKLNLSRRHAAIFQRIILTGNDMAKALKAPEVQEVQPKHVKKLPVKWGKLMVELVELLF